MGCYVISVSAGTGCYRHIQISKDATLYMLHKAIISAFDFDDDHAHAFFMDNKYWGRGEAYFSEQLSPGEPVTKSRKLRKLGLEKGRQFKYLFDFGSEWRFQCKVLRENDDRVDIPFVVRSVGASPEQYPQVDWDDEFDTEDEDGRDEEMEEELQQQMKELRQLLNLPEETVDLARQYFIAAARLYGAIPLFMLWDIYNKQNDPIGAEQFIVLATIFDAENHHFGVIGPEVFDEQVEPNPFNWYVAADELLEDEADDFFELREGQAGKPYKIFPKEEFLKFADEEYFPLTPQSLAMRDYLRSHGDLRWPDDSWIGIQTMILIDFSIHEILAVLGSEGFEGKSLADIETFMGLFQELNNHTPKRINCGHTPEELYEKMHGRKRSNKPATPSLNGPCPCGSGKKYKRCCGKNQK